MFALAALIVGLLCSFISRALLVVGAFSVSFWWGLGVFLPFGPAIFRHTYPDQSHGSRKFGIAALPCFFLFVALGGFTYLPGSSGSRFSIMDTSPLLAYARENKPPVLQTQKAAPAPTAPPNLEERRAINYREFQRLNAWSEALKLRKRDLLHSDTEGNRIYEIELAQYKAALANANAEKDAFARLTK
jgi:hypothetical protein